MHWRQRGHRFTRSPEVLQRQAQLRGDSRGYSRRCGGCDTRHLGSSDASQAPPKEGIAASSSRSGRDASCGIVGGDGIYRIWGRSRDNTAIAGRERGGTRKKTKARKLLRDYSFMVFFFTLNPPSSHLEKMYHSSR